MGGRSFRVAFCGLISALALVLMLLTGLVPVGTYAFPIFAGAMLTAVVIEFGAGYGFLAFAAVALLSLFLSGDKEAAVYFTAFFGYYPVLKSLIERIKSAPVQWIIKFSVFTAAITAAFFVCKFVFLLPDEEFTVFGFYLPWAFLLAGEVFFPLYDRCVTVIVMLYVQRIRERIFKSVH